MFAAIDRNAALVAGSMRAQAPALAASPETAQLAIGDRRKR